MSDGMFTTASAVEDCVWSMRLADFTRAQNRARINDLFNGLPPYSDAEVKQNNGATNVNFLESTTLAHDARRQFYNAFIKPGKFFTVKADVKPKHKKQEWSTIITTEMNRIMKKSLPYFETFRSTFASVVLHGIGPKIWEDDQSWCPDAVGVEDVMIPGGTYLTFKNMPLYAIYRPYTAMQLVKMTQNEEAARKAGWNMPLVKRLIETATKEVLSSGWGGGQLEINSPEKLSEAYKQDQGLISTDRVPTIDCWDFYFWNDEDDVQGWNRRIVLDANYELMAGAAQASVKELKSKSETRNQFLFNPGKRKYASKLSNLCHFQFGDLSAVAPFRYHSVRSMGFLLYAVCHLQNRLRCKFNDAIFEGMLQYFRVRSSDELERTLKINLVNMGIIDETVQFIPQAERWTVNHELAVSGIAHNREIMGSNSASYTQNYDFGKEKTQKTATQIMAEVNSTTALVSSALQQAYTYQTFEYYEIGRRFCKENSRDPDVRLFRVRCLAQGVPKEALDSDAWEIEAERVMGAGNKTLEMAIANQLMAWRPMFDPESQRIILRQGTLAVTDDPGLTDTLVPKVPNKITSTVHDAQLTSAALMMGLKVDPTPGANHIEVIETLLGEMAIVVDKINKRGAMPTPDELQGLGAMAAFINGHIGMLAQDKNEQERAKGYANDLGQLNNIVKAFAQHLQEAQKAAAEQQGGNGEMDEEGKAKIAATIIGAKAKADLGRESHAQRTAQRQTQWELEQSRKSEQHQQEMEQKAQEDAMDLAKQQAEAEIDLKKKQNDAKATVSNGQ